MLLDTSTTSFPAVSEKFSVFVASGMRVLFASIFWSRVIRLLYFKNQSLTVGAGNSKNADIECLDTAHLKRRFSIDFPELFQRINTSQYIDQKFRTSQRTTVYSLKLVHGSVDGGQKEPKLLFRDKRRWNHTKAKNLESATPRRHPQSKIGVLPCTDFWPNLAFSEDFCCILGWRVHLPCQAKVLEIIGRSRFTLRSRHIATELENRRSDT